MKKLTPSFPLSPHEAFKAEIRARHARKASSRAQVKGPWRDRNYVAEDETRVLSPTTN